MCTSSGTKRTNLCSSDTAVKKNNNKYVIWERKSGAKTFFNGQVANDSHESAIVKSKSDTRRSGGEAFSGLVPTLHVRFLDVSLAHNFSEKVVIKFKMILAYTLQSPVNILFFPKTYPEYRSILEREKILLLVNKTSFINPNPSNRGRLVLYKKTAIWRPSRKFFKSSQRRKLCRNLSSDSRREPFFQ